MGSENGQTGRRSLMVLCSCRKHGFLGLYKGLEAKLLQTVLTAALMFVVYEKITAATFRLMGLSKKLKHWEVLLECTDLIGACYWFILTLGCVLLSYLTGVGLDWLLGIHNIFIQTTGGFLTHNGIWALTLWQLPSMQITFLFCFHSRTFLNICYITVL